MKDRRQANEKAERESAKNEDEPIGHAALRMSSQP